jgi:hypothetical protein
MPIKSKPPAGRQRRERARGSPRPPRSPRSPRSPVASWGWSFGTLGTWVHAPGYRSYMAGRTWSLNCSPSLEQAAGQALNLASRGRAPQRPNKIASASPWDGSSSRRSSRRDARPSLRAKRSHASIACSGNGRQPASRSWCWQSSSTPRCWRRTDGADRGQETESAELQTLGARVLATLAGGTIQSAAEIKVWDSAGCTRGSATRCKQHPVVARRQRWS